MFRVISSMICLFLVIHCLSVIIAASQLRPGGAAADSTTTAPLKKTNHDDIPYRYPTTNNTLLVVEEKYPKQQQLRQQQQQQQQQQQPKQNFQRRRLPERVLIGYSTRCDDDRVQQAVREGVNVVIWAFYRSVLSPDNDKISARCIENTIRQLDEEGYDDTVHLLSLGGWNGPHLEDDPRIRENATEWYRSVWKGEENDEHRHRDDGSTTKPLGSIFHGIDWDLEGNDNLRSSRNNFSTWCLDTMGRISRWMNRDGYTVTMAPPQSYLDPETPGFSRSVNLTRNTTIPPWTANGFHYFGKNVYAYLLSRYGRCCIDLVSIQYYESYSRANMAIQHYNVTQEQYLYSYNTMGNRKSTTGSSSNKRGGLRFWVDFEQDPQLGYKSRTVHLPLSKLVWGFANGWATTRASILPPLNNNEEQTIKRVQYFEPEQIRKAYDALRALEATPRGFMFWVIQNEGQNGVNYTKDLNDILHIRTAAAAAGAAAAMLR